MRRLFIGAVVCSGLLLAYGTLRGDQNAEPPPAPLGLPPVFWPEENPYTPEKRELGWLLYFDTRLHRHQGTEGGPQRAHGHQSRLQHRALLGWPRRLA
jgi:hypothetical protein